MGKRYFFLYRQECAAFMSLPIKSCSTMTVTSWCLNISTHSLWVGFRTTVFLSFKVNVNPIIHYLQEQSSPVDVFTSAWMLLERSVRWRTSVAICDELISSCTVPMLHKLIPKLLLPNETHCLEITFKSCRVWVRTHIFARTRKKKKQ